MEFSLEGKFVKNLATGLTTTLYKSNRCSAAITIQPACVRHVSTLVQGKPTEGSLPGLLDQASALAEKIQVFLDIK